MKVDINKNDWRNLADHIQVSHLEWNGLVDTLIDDGYQESKTKYKTTKRGFPPGTYRFDDDKRDKSMYAVNWEGKLIHFFTMDDDEKNDDEHVRGSEALREINLRFTNMYNISFIAAFGTWERGEEDPHPKSKEKEYCYELDNCHFALPPLIECDEFFKNKILNNVYKADISSAYPYQSTLPLPTKKGMIKKKGAHLPPAGYVAYWKNSGHIIEGMEGGVDTRKLLTDPLYKNKHKFNPINEKEEITYLLPYSNYDLAPIINELYDKKKISPRFKGILNSFIGRLYTRKYYQQTYMGHISALVLARHITYMCELTKILKSCGCYPIMFATDSILWLGGPCEIASKEKYIGSFVSEYENCRAAYKSCGNYVIEDPITRSLGLVRHQGIAESSWKSSRIETVEDYLAVNIFLKSERFNHKTHKYELYDIIEV